MFRVKICGITSQADALVAADAGADAVGLNFYSGSPRCCPLEQAREIAAALPAGVCRVGVFVNATADEIRRTAREVPLDLIQLHGDEPPGFLHKVRPLAVLRAMRISDDLSAVEVYLEACHRAGAMPRMLLLDAHRAGQPRGTGVTLDWEFLAKHRQHLRGVPLVLAGGLTVDNVATAVATVRPWAVDVASGVETAPGVKSAEMVRRFVTAANQALDGLVART